jgi:quercetin dioxygenase-like cupin family protein
MTRNASALRIAATCIGLAAIANCAAGVAQTVQEKPLAITPAAATQWGPCPPIFPNGCQISVLHGDPAKPNADIFLRVPAGYEIPAHTHTSPERMVLVEGLLRVRYDGAGEEMLSVGEYAYGPARLPHVARCMSSTQCTLFIAFEGPVDAIAHEGAMQ